MFTVFTMTEQRENILARACDLYLEEGLEGFSMRQLAKRVGVTAPALYRHFESREQVLLDVVREAFREFTGYLYRALEGRTPLDRLRRAGAGYLDFALEHPRWYQMVFIAPEHIGQETLPEDLESQGCAVHQFWIDRLRECVEAGLLHPGDPTEISLTMWAHAHGLIELYQRGHLQMDEEEFRETYRESGARMMMGIATDEYRAEVAREQEAVPTGAHL
jgi:AcrR family transcriptional regulator